MSEYCEQKNKSSKLWKVIIITAVFLLAALIVINKKSAPTYTNTEESPSYETLISGGELPSFVELGSDSCTPCIEMKSVLAALRTNYSDSLNVYFIDVTKDSQTPSKFKITMIPTQILLDKNGKELFRHEGFFPLDDVVKKWNELGLELEEPTNHKAGTLENIFNTLSKAMELSAFWALVATFVWGILSIILSPCHLASIPLIVGFIDQQGVISTKRACYISTLFSVGILLTIGAIGFITAYMGAQAGEIGDTLNYIVSGIFIIVGLYLLDVIKFSFKGIGQIKMKKRGAFAAFILGLIFGIALGPCTFAYMAPVLALVFKVGGDNLSYAFALLLAYGIGHCSVIIAAGTSAEVVQHYLNWNERSKGTVILRSICGVLVIIGGLYLLGK